MEEYTKNHQNTKETTIILVGIGSILLIISGYFIIPLFFSEKTSGNNPSQKDVSEETFHFISLKEAYDLLNTQNITIVDVRSGSDYYSQHIIDSIHRESAEFQNFLSSQRNKEESLIVLLVGYTEETGSLLSTQILLEQTFPHITVFTLSGGFSSWREASYPSFRAGDPTDPIDQTKVEYISPQEAHTRIPTQDIFLLDVRNVNDFKQDHINISHNIPLSLLESKRTEIPRSKIILAYGTNAMESFQAGVRLFDLGFFQVLTLDGGYQTLIETAPGAQKSQE